MGIAEKALVLKRDFDEVYKAGASDFGLKGKGQGELVTLNNVHPIEHKVEVGLGSKNLFNEAEANITKTEDYFSSNANYWESPCLTISVESGATYTATVEYHTPNTTTFNAIIAFSISTEKTYTTAAKSLMLRTKTENSTASFTKTVSTFTIPNGIEEICFITNADNTFFKNIQIEKSTTPTTYAPFVADFSDCKVITSGKNICNLQVPYSIVPDKIITLWESNIPQYIGYRFDTTVESQVSGGSAAMWRFTRADGTLFYDLSYKTFPSGKITTEKAVKVEIVNYVRMVGTIDKIQIEIGTTPSEYTEYVEPTEYTANADGTVEGVKSISPVMNLSTDKAGAVINAECFLDPQAVITSLTNTVITLGGEV